MCFFHPFVKGQVGPRKAFNFFDRKQTILGFLLASFNIIIIYVYCCFSLFSAIKLCIFYGNRRLAFENN